MIYNSDAANEYARTHIGFVDRQFGDLRQALASAYDAGWTGRSIGLQHDPDAEKRADLTRHKIDLDVIRALGYDVVKGES